MIKKIFSSLLAAAFLAGLSVSIVGCNTVEGVGKDMQRGGSAIRDEANEQRR